jgi:RNA polymerase sigma-70 factor (ECF subfamily)
MIGHRGYNIHQDLIDRCIKGDKLAQSEVYRLYYKAMYNTCYRMLDDKVEAEDVMQESFLAAFLKISTYRGEMSFGSWLKKIVIHKTIDVLRARKVQFEELNDRMGLPDETDEEVLERQNDEYYRVEKIREAVRKLPEGFRIVLSLALFEGYDHEEIALILKINKSTSRSQLTRAKKKLIEYLKEKKDETFG